jgi:pimeloyl-ACP methyl ester carboxylesterase
MKPTALAELTRAMWLAPLQSYADVLTATAQNLAGVTEQRDGTPVPNMFTSAIPYYWGSLIDRMTVGITMALAPSPTPREIVRIRREAARAAEVVADKGWVANPELLHGKPQSPRFLGEPKIAPLDRERDRIKLTFESAFRPDRDLPGSHRYGGQKSLFTADANLIRYRDGTDRPWVIYLHGLSMGGDDDLTTMGADKVSKDLGVNVLTVPFPFHGRRQVGPHPGVGALGTDIMSMFFTLTQGISDVRQMIAWIREQHEKQGLPPPKIAAVGASMGGYAAGMLAGLEKLDSVVALIPVDSLVELIRPASRIFGADYVENAAKALAPIAHASLPPLSGAHVHHVIGALGDQMSTAPAATRMAKHLGVEAEWTPGGHLTAIATEHDRIRDLLRRDGIVG